MKKNYKVFIVEGEKREPRIIKNLKENFFLDDIIEYKVYSELIDPLFIYKKEKDLGDTVLILSAFPEFLLDYFKEEFWNKYLK